MEKELQNHFNQFRKNIVGIDATFESPVGKQNLIYADWIASGRLYAPIEDKIKKQKSGIYCHFDDNNVKSKRNDNFLD